MNENGKICDVKHRSIKFVPGIFRLRVGALTCYCHDRNAKQFFL